MQKKLKVKFNKYKLASKNVKYYIYIYMRARAIEYQKSK